MPPFRPRRARPHRGTAAASLAALALVPLLACGPADPGADPGHEPIFAAMDSAYDRFVRAYRLGEPDSVVALYTDTPLYLPGRGSVVEGREGLRSQFDFLERIRADSATAHISFSSVDRGASGDLAWDVGYYTLEVEHPDGSRSDPSRGKFATVWRRDAEGRWRIHIDAFSPAPPPDG